MARSCSSMEFAPATQQPYCSIRARPYTPSRSCSSNSLSFIRNRSQIPNFSVIVQLQTQRCIKFPGCHFLANPVTLHKSCLAAVIDEKAALPINVFEEKTLSDKSVSTASHEELTIENENKATQDDGLADLDNDKMIRICDKLVDVFMVDKPTPTDWRRLLAFSKEWNNIRPHFYKRCQELADSKEDPGMKHKLLKFRRKLKEIDEDVQRHNELLDVIKEAESRITKVVARRRKDFTKEFFVHLQTVAESYYDNQTKQTALAKLGIACLAAVEAYDGASESIDAVHAAELKFQDIINSPSLDVACRKIDSLAEKNQLDSALVLMMTKAWSAAKDSSMMKDEVKDILYHLYKTARGNLQRLMPKEIRIVKYLLTIEDPEELLCSLKEAFTPGEEFEGQDLDALYTTPEKLHTWIQAVVHAYHFSKEGTLISEAKDLMNPTIIQKMEELKKVLEKSFM